MQSALELFQVILVMLFPGFALFGVGCFIWLLPGCEDVRPDQLRCPRCHFVSYPGDLKLHLTNEHRQEAQPDCGRDHRPCPCQQK